MEELLFCFEKKIKKKLSFSVCKTRPLATRARGGINKLESYIRLDWKSLPGTNTPAFGANIDCWGIIIHNTSFSSLVMNGPKKLECYIRLNSKSLPGTNTLAFQA
jgi:hypothetical protein